MKKITLILSLIAVISFQAQNLLSDASQSKNLSFKENKGQISDQFFKPRPDILFSGTDGNLNFYLKNNGISYQLNQIDKWSLREDFSKSSLVKIKSEQKTASEITVYRLDIDWINCNPFSEILKSGELSGHENYYTESCPNGALHIKSYRNLTYKNIYAGIDLKWYESSGNLKYDYIVAPYANYKVIQLLYKGAEKLSLNKNGELIIKTALADVVEQKPFVTQNGKQLDAKWVITNNIVSFEIQNVDPSQKLIIDPMVRLWASYYGGTNEDYTSYCSTDALSNVIISGSTKSTANIATTGAHQLTLATTNSFDAYVAKFDQLGNRLWATYYGGADAETGLNCRGDNNGNTILLGVTSSSNSAVLTTIGAHQTSCSVNSANSSDLFLVKFDGVGVRQWGTYYGGDGAENYGAINIDNLGNIYIAGNSASANNISTPLSHQPSMVGNMDCILVKFNSSGVRQWGTYYGGTGSFERAAICTIDLLGNIYLVGGTNSNSGISTPGSHQQVIGGNGNFDGFLAKFNSAGSLLWGTYYGGPNPDFFSGCVLDASGNIYCSGVTEGASGSIIATPGSHQSTFGGGGTDAMLVKFDMTGQRLFGTYYGGSASDVSSWTQISMDPFGDIYICGNTSSTNGTSIATPCAYQSTHGGGSDDLFLVKFSPGGNRIWGTYYGGIYSDYDPYCATDPQGNIYISGSTLANSGTIIATNNSYQPNYGGGLSDGFIVKFDGCIPGSAIDLTSPSNHLVCIGDTAILSASCGNWYATSTDNNLLGTGGSYTTGTIYSDTTFYVEDFGCGSITGTRTAVSLTVVPSPTLNITNSNPTACVGENIILSASGASSYTWASNTSTISSSLQVIVFLHSTYTVNGEDANGCKNTATIQVIPELCLGITNIKGIHSKIIVYPNPNKGTFTIQSDSELSLILTNELGQVIRNLNLSLDYNFTHQLKNLSPGIYFLKGDGRKQIINQKIIVID